MGIAGAEKVNGHVTTEPEVPEFAPVPMGGFLRPVAEMDASSCSRLSAALAKAIAASKAVGLDSKNEFHGYRYASADAVMEAARGALAANGISVLREQQDVQFDRVDEVDAKGNKTGYVELYGGLLVSSWRVQHESGEFRIMQSVWPFYCEKGRPIDKALAGGLTASLAYFIRDLLMLPRLEADDTETHPDRRDDRDYQPRRGAERPAAQRRPVPDATEARPDQDEAKVKLLQMPEGYPKPGGEGLGAEFVEYATRQLELAAKTWDDVKAFVLTKTDDKSRCAGEPHRWDPALGVGIAHWIEIRKRQQDGRRATVPTQEAAAAAVDGSSAATAKNPRTWHLPDGKKLTPAHPGYWQAKALKNIETVLRSVNKDLHAATVLAKVEAKYHITGEKVEDVACQIYKRVIDEMSQGVLDVTAFVDPD